MARRTERLLALVLLLTSTKRALTRSEIRSAIGEYGDGPDDAFERMFERDKDELRSMGIPIDTVEQDAQDEGFGYRLAATNTFLPTLELDPAESLVLALAARSWGEAAWGAAAVLGLRKLEVVGDFEAPATDTISMSANVETGALSAILDAAASGRRVSFSYRKPGGESAATRRVEPWGVVADHGRWYLVGNDVDRQAVRVFRLSRITGAVSMSGPVDSFKPPIGDDLRKYVTSAAPTEERVAARVRLQPNAASRLATSATAVLADIATFDSVDPQWLITQVLRAGSAAQLLEPVELREQVHEALKAVVSAHRVPRDDECSAALCEMHSRRAPTKARAEETAVRLSRLLALVPWLQNHPGVSYADAAAHFGVSTKRLRQDLELAVCTEFGPHLLTLDIDVWGDRLTVRDPQGITAPLALAPDEAMSLLVGLRLLSQVPGPHDRDALARVESKLADLAGIEQASALRYLSIAPETTASGPEVTAAVQQALAAGQALHLTYWGAARDQMSDRIVDPVRLLTTRGESYLDAWCRQAEAFRLFRLDRIASATVLAEPATIPENTDSKPSGTSTVALGGATATFVLDPTVGWLADQIPTNAISVLSDGRTVMQVSLGSASWAVRLLLASAGQVRVLEPPELVAALVHEAQAAVAFYGS